jgi:hypothetical protein
VFPDDELAVDLVHVTELLVMRAKMTILEEQAIACAQDTTGIVLTSLWPPSTAIMIVTVDGVHVGRVRREYPGFLPERWVAVPRAGAPVRGPFRSSVAAARALVDHPTSRRKAR